MPAAKHKSDEIQVTRLYNAPVQAVWKAWTDPEQVASWWGPRGFTLTTHSKQLRSGGNWQYTMHGPDGVNYPNKTVYFEVEKYSRLVYDHGGNDDRPPLFKVSVLFSEQNGKTKMDLSMKLPTPEAAEETRRFIKRAGGDATWDRLAEYLEKELNNRDVFVINRTFTAPLDLVFKMWTDPKCFSRWLPPTGFEMQFIRRNIRAGGSTFYMMTDGRNTTLYGRTQYLEIESPDHLVYTQQFCDKGEEISRHPLTPTWPETMLTTVSLAAEGLERTRVTVKWEPYGPATQEEIDVFASARAGMTVGWTGSFDKLEALLDED